MINIHMSLQMRMNTPQRPAQSSLRRRMVASIPFPCAGVEASALTPAGLSPFPAGYFWDLDENEKI